MKRIYFFILFFTISLFTYSQPGRQNYVYAIYFLDTQIGWFSNWHDSIIFKTTDGGESWVPQNLPSTWFYSINFVSDSVGFMIGNKLPLNTIFKTTDRGETWNLFTLGLGELGRSFLYFRNEFVGYAIRIYEYGSIETNGSILLKTKDGGKNWDTIYVLPYSYANQMWVHNNGDDVTMYGGRSWDSNYGGLIARNTDSLYYVFPPGFVQNVIFIDSLRGFAKRDSTEGWYRRGMDKTTDGGRSWFHDTLECAGDFVFTDSLNGFASIMAFYTNTEYNTLGKTTNAGITWEILKDYTPGGTWIRHWYFVDSKNGVILTTGPPPDNNYVTYRTNDGGYTWEELGHIITHAEEEDSGPPDVYSLSQNYPNPFNPATTIKYSLVNRSFVSLEIFDVLGNKAAVIVNEEKEAGEHEAHWNASEFSSGVYFYRMKAGGFIQTKKLMLVK